MKQILFLVAILFAGVGYSQNKDYKGLAVGGGGYFSSPGRNIELTESIKRNGDTLTVIDKTIKFIVIDGVTYEIVRSTEIKKAEQPASILTWPRLINAVMPYEINLNTKQ